MENLIYEKVDKIKRPLKLGEIFNVPCIVKRDGNDIVCFTPVINTPHSDNENGQPEIHYHTDYRFIKIKESKNISEGFIITDDRIGFKNSIGRLSKDIDGLLEYHNLPVINENHNGITQQFFIRNSKLKHKCIQKGKCPHRGHDLSQEKSVNGIITCPLHGLQFNSETGDIIKDTLDNLKKAKDYEVKYKTSLNIGLALINKIKDGDIITREYHDKLIYNNSLMNLYQTYEKEERDLLYCVWTKTMNNEYPPKKMEFETILKFKVKLK